MENGFYTYIYLDPRKPGKYNYGEYSFEYEPIYVGKGKNNRCEIHIRYAKRKSITDTSFFTKKLRRILESNLEPIIIKVNENLSESIAFELEKELIGLIKRYPDGPLTNLSDGGVGGDCQSWNPEYVEVCRQRFLTDNPMHDPEIKKYIGSIILENNNRRVKEGTHHFITNAPMKDPIKASMISKKRRAKANPENVNRAVTASNKARIWTPEMKAKQAEDTRIRMNKAKQIREEMGGSGNLTSYLKYIK
jgi:hypothetical protein